MLLNRKVFAALFLTSFSLAFSCHYDSDQGSVGSTRPSSDRIAFIYAIASQTSPKQTYSPALVRPGTSYAQAVVSPASTTAIELYRSVSPMSLTDEPMTDAVKPRTQRPRFNFSSADNALRKAQTFNAFSPREI